MNSIYLEELYMEMAKVLQKKYVRMNEVCRLTKEIADSLSRDDMVSVNILLEMRGEELENAADCDKNLYLLAEHLPEDMQQMASAMLKGKEAYIPADNVIWNKMKDIVNNTRTVLKQTIEFDRHMSCRLAGEDSFYRQ